eukprot:TRINITY_DN4019_c0_g3_i1.p1 TRINITY_DN4019_c0_g3~~TRINITY_DN4019_c0_g3_i1.p1  ORF type:complete len:358 (-),score=76.28 TRINITY_DN4019_c0_g3_i1:13-1086(-)
MSTPSASDPTKRKKKAKSPAQRLDEAHATPNALPGQPYEKASSETDAKRPRTESVVPSHHSQKGRLYTVSVAVPASILPAIYSLELKTFIAGQIARILAVHRVDEIIVYGDKEKPSNTGRSTISALLCRLLEYTETPQYLRKTLFPVHPDLKHAGLLLPLESAHHLKFTEWCQYRDGVVMDRPVREKRGSFVDIGLKVPGKIGITIRPHTRVTLDLGTQTPSESAQYYYGDVTSPLTPKEKLGLYWGYSTRQAQSIQSVIKECPYDEGYDVKIAISDAGEAVLDEGYQLPKFKHLLLVLPERGGFGNNIDGEDGLDAEDLKRMFELHMNPYPATGTRGLRIEESLNIALARLTPLMQ